MKTTLHAQLAVKLARDTYLQAALEGNLGSPKIQTELEEILQKSRALLEQACEAEERGDEETAKDLINQILALTQIVMAERTSDTKILKTTLHAQLAVELARDTYLQAVLEGNLASPRIQSELEMNLNQSHALLVEAYTTEEKGEKKATQDLIYQIAQLIKKVMTECQESKK